MKTNTTKATPQELRRVLDCALAWKTYIDNIKDRGEHPGERVAFMKGFVAGRGSLDDF